MYPWFVGGVQSVFWINGDAVYTVSDMSPFRGLLSALASSTTFFNLYCRLAHQIAASHNQAWYLRFE